LHYALWRHPEVLRTHPEAPIDTLQDVLRELFRSYVTPSCGDPWPRGHSISSTPGSIVLRGSGLAKLSLFGIERCRKGYDIYALSRVLGERDRVGQAGGSMGLMLLSVRSPTPLCPSGFNYPVAGLALIMDT